MKRMKYLYYFLITLLLLSCKDNNSIEKNALLVVSSTSVILSNNKPYAEITIVKGAGTYSVSSSNEAVAQPLLIDNKLYITGYNIGSAIITLTDLDKNQVNIKVTLDELIPRVSPVSNIAFIKRGDTKNITNTDPSPLYYLMDTASAIKVGGTANNLQITAQRKGTATLYYLKEYWPTTIYNIQVVDHYIFSVSPTTATLRLAVGAESEYYILSGCGNYSLTVSNTSAITAELLAWPIAPALSQSNPRVIHIKALKSGSSELKITNVETSEEKTVIVTVG
jgi:hypothetical protein